MKKPAAVRLDVPPLSLGEGPVWHDARQMLYFVDIDGRMLYGFNAREGIACQVRMPGKTGFAVPYGRNLLAGCGHALCEVDPDAGTVTPLLEIPLEAGIRFNDGKCDPAGRLFAGTMAEDRARPDTAACGALHLIDAQGVRARLAPMDIPNGMAWDGIGHFYHTDTATGWIDRYDIRPDGWIANRTHAIQVTEGSPDGFAIDAEGMLWVALWGAGRVQRYNPQTGAALEECVTVPQMFTSCCCFGGPDGHTLYITTAEGPDGPGALYACRTQAAGAPPYGWRG